MRSKRQVFWARSKSRQASPKRLFARRAKGYYIRKPEVLGLVGSESQGSGSDRIANEAGPALMISWLRTSSLYPLSTPHHKPNKPCSYERFNLVHQDQKWKPGKLKVLPLAQKASGIWHHYLGNYWGTYSLEIGWGIKVTTKPTYNLMIEILHHPICATN